MDIPNIDSLKFVSSVDLIDELFSRFDYCMFVGCANDSEKRGTLGWNCKGDFFALTGLVSWATNRIRELEPADPNK